MDITSLDRTASADWDAFCAASDQAWFWHTTSFLNYTLVYRPDLRSHSLAFLVTEGSKILAVCPLLLERYEDGREFSFGGSFAPAPALANEVATNPRRRAAVLNALFGEVDRLAREHEVRRALMHLSPLEPSFFGAGVPPANWLLQHGFVDASINTLVVDLAKDPEVLLRDMRKGHRSDITRGLKQMTEEAYDGVSVTADVLRRYQEMHEVAAGRTTRPQATFDLMGEWAQRGDALIVGARREGIDIGFSVFFTYKDGAYYASSANAPDARDAPVGHVLQWAAIRWLRDHGYRWYEVGWQQYGPLPYDFPSAKELAIARFKRGFGGVIVPLFRGERFYSRDFYRRTAVARSERYAATLRP